MKQTPRLASIDCFRGFAVLAMVLATYLFGTEAVPAWLRHAPDGRLTVVDLPTHYLIQRWGNSVMLDRFPKPVRPMHRRSAYE